MRLMITIMVGVSLFWIISSFGQLPPSDGYFWLRLFGCVCIGMVVGFFYDPSRTNR